MIPLAVVLIDLCLSPKSKSANYAIHKAVNEVKSKALKTPEYLRLTPVLLDEADRYDYGRYDLWSKIDYLPEGVQNLPFFQPNPSGAYENTLINNLNTLNQIKRSRNIRRLKQK